MTERLAASGVLRELSLQVDGPVAHPTELGQQAWGAPGVEQLRLADADAAGDAPGGPPDGTLNSHEPTPAEGAESPARLDADPHAAARPTDEWMPAEREALDRGARAGAVDAGQGWASDVVEGLKEGAIVAGQAAVVGAERAAQALARPPEPTGTGWLDGIKGALHTANPLTHVGRGVDWLIPDDFANEQAQSLQDKGAAFIDGLRELPDMPEAVVEKFEADLELASALEDAYRAGRADLSVLEESARVRAQAQTEAGILAAEVGATALASVGAGLKLTRALRQLDVDDVLGGALAAMTRDAQVSRSLAEDLRAFVADESGAVRLGFGPDAQLDRAGIEQARAERAALAARRYEPGTASGAGQPVGADWMRRGVAEGGAPIPEQVAERLAGQEFASFDAYREAFWREVAADPDLAAQFGRANQARMSEGHAPFAPHAEHVGGRDRFELDHRQRLVDGGAVYDADNLRAMTPRAHVERHRGD